MKADSLLMRTILMHANQGRTVSMQFEMEPPKVLLMEAEAEKERGLTIQEIIAKNNTHMFTNPYPIEVDKVSYLNRRERRRAERLKIKK